MRHVKTIPPEKTDCLKLDFDSGLLRASGSGTDARLIMRPVAFLCCRYAYKFVIS